MCRIESPTPSLTTMIEIIVTLIYWVLFVFAVLGALGSIVFVLCGRWNWLMVSVALMAPYVGVWVLDYGSNCLIRKEIPVAATLISASVDALSDGRNVVVRLTPQQRTFYDEPTVFEFTNYGTVDNRPVSVVEMTTKRGVDGLVASVDVHLFVPNIGSSGTRLNAMHFGKRRYGTKSQVLSFDDRYTVD